MVADDIRLGEASDRRDDARAQQSGHLNACQAYAAGRAGDQDRFAVPDLRAVDERVIRCEVYVQQSRSCDEIYAIGQQRRSARRCGHLLREGAVPALAGHPIAGSEAVDLFADRHDNAGRVRARHVRERGPHLITAAGHEVVHIAHRRGVDVDKHLVGPWTGFRRFADG